LGWRFSDDLSKELEVGSIKKGGTIEELARMIGVDSEGLVNTVSNWNRNTLKGGDPDFDRSVVAPINNPPYYAGYVKNYVGSNYGGLKIDTKCNVIHISGKVIPRLYAAGSTSGGCIGKLHLGGGTLLSKSMTFGRIAGMNAANEISW
jgi:fumarate reductase flavoprotein subunit